MKPPTSLFVTNVQLLNYKSIAKCNIDLAPLNYLVGPNGAGKSNFLDSLRFTTDSLRFSLDHALRDRGGVKEVRRRSSGHPTHFEIRLGFTLPTGQTGRYGFRVGAEKDGGYAVQYEECIAYSVEPLGKDAYYRIENGDVVKSSLSTPPAASADRLYLVNASGFPEFRPIYDAFSRMAFYNLNPEKIRALQPPDSGRLLNRDGSNLASVFERIGVRSESAKTRIEEYLSKVVPGIEGVDARGIGPMETLEFRQRIRGAKSPWNFLAANMSDGTLRAFGVITALLQNFDAINQNISLVGIEEPEVALHPAAAAVLRDVLREGSETTQVIVTSHSPDLLDDSNIDPAAIIGVSANDGETHIRPIGDVALSAIRGELYTPGELLRLNQLVSNDEVAEFSRSQPELLAGRES